MASTLPQDQVSLVVEALRSPFNQFLTWEKTSRAVNIQHSERCRKIFLFLFFFILALYWIWIWMEYQQRKRMTLCLEGAGVGGQRESEFVSSTNAQQKVMCLWRTLCYCKDSCEDMKLFSAHNTHTLTLTHTHTDAHTLLCDEHQQAHMPGLQHPHHPPISKQLLRWRQRLNFNQTIN